MERDDRAATQLKQRLQQFYAENSQHFRLNETVFLCAEHKMGTAFVGTLIRKLLSLLPYDQRCILKGGSSTQPAMCNMVELVNGTLQRVPGRDHHDVTAHIHHDEDSLACAQVVLRTCSTWVTCSATKFLLQEFGQLWARDAVESVGHVEGQHCLVPTWRF
eukprot:scaffold517_cov392-Prasinococcus_capsulatus_cf.AAC.2